MAAPHLNREGFVSRCMGDEATLNRFFEKAKELPNALYLASEAAIQRNLERIRSIQEAAGVEFILALKAFSHYPLFPLFKETIKGMTCSSLNETLLAKENFGGELHIYAPAYTEEDFRLMLEASPSHITFNSLSQYRRFAKRAIANGISCGIRINPEFSTVETDLYNPCVGGSRLGVFSSLIEEWPSDLPFPEGFHSHNLCESGAEAAHETLLNIERLFGANLSRLKWLNLGGGHLVTKEGYDSIFLIQTLLDFKQRYPNLRLLLEPGSAFLWQTGVLVARIEDIVESAGIKTAILNISFSCHMPDCLEMPYLPNIWGAISEEEAKKNPKLCFPYRIGGCSCLAGDFMGDFYFASPLEVGQPLIFDDMFHYTMVKTTSFNGVASPSVGILLQTGAFKLTRSYGYEEYKLFI